MTYFKSGQAPYVKEEARLSDGSVWYLAYNITHNGQRRDFWLKEDLSKMMVANLRESLHVFPRSLSLRGEERQTVDILFDLVPKFSYIECVADNPEAVSISWEKAPAATGRPSWRWRENNGCTKRSPCGMSRRTAVFRGGITFAWRCCYPV